MSSRSLVISLLLLALATLIQEVHAYLTYETQHFTIYYEESVSVSYVESVAKYLEKYYSLYSSLGLRLAKPCSAKYIVYVKPISGEGGYAHAKILYDPDTGQITSLCVDYLIISSNLRGDLVEFVVAHELAHVVEYAYMRYVTIAEAYSTGPPYSAWYIEGIADALALIYDRCGTVSYLYYMYDSLYSRNPYELRPYTVDPYAYSVFFYWLIRVREMNLQRLLENTFSSRNVVNKWLDEAYIEFLLSFYHGVTLCGSRIVPHMVTVYLGEDSRARDLTASLDGYSALYIRITVEKPGIVTVVTTPSLVSNIKLESPVTVRRSLTLVLVNPWYDEVEAHIHIWYTPLLSVKILKAVLSLDNMTLTMRFRVIVEGEELASGTVYVNATPVRVRDGVGVVSLRTPRLGALRLIFRYNNYQDVVTVRAESPTVLNYPREIPMLSNSIEKLNITLTNRGDVELTCRTSLSASAPVRLLEPRALTLKPGEVKTVTLVMLAGNITKPVLLYLNICLVGLQIESIPARLVIENITLNIVNNTGIALIRVQEKLLKIKLHDVETLPYSFNFTVRLSKVIITRNITVSKPVVKLHVNSSVVLVKHSVEISLTIRGTSYRNCSIVTLAHIGDRSSLVKISDRRSLLLKLTFSPTREGKYVIPVSIAGIYSSNITLYAVKITHTQLTGHDVQVGTRQKIRLVLEYSPAQVNVTVTLTLSGCINMTVILEGNRGDLRWSKILEFDHVCELNLELNVLGRLYRWRIAWTKIEIIPILHTFRVINGTPVLVQGSCISFNLLYANNMSRIKHAHTWITAKPRAQIYTTNKTVCFLKPGKYTVQANFTHDDIWGEYRADIIVVPQFVPELYNMATSIPRVNKTEIMHLLDRYVYSLDFSTLKDFYSGLKAYFTQNTLDYIGQLLKLTVMNSLLETGNYKSFLQLTHILTLTPIISALIPTCIVAAIITRITVLKRRRQKRSACLSVV